MLALTVGWHGKHQHRYRRLVNSACTGRSQAAAHSSPDADPKEGTAMITIHRPKAARGLLTTAVVAVLVSALGATIPASPALAAPGPSFTNPLVGTPNSA